MVTFYIVHLRSGSDIVECGPSRRIALQIGVLAHSYSYTIELATVVAR